MNDYALIFRHEDGNKVGTPELIESWMQQTRDWIAGIAAQGKFVGGFGLPFTDAMVVGHNGVVTTGPFGNPGETIGGYIVVRAETMDQAVAFAKGSPVLQGAHNTVEVRKIAG